MKVKKSVSIEEYHLELLGLIGNGNLSLAIDILVKDYYKSDHLLKEYSKLQNSDHSDSTKFYKLSGLIEGLYMS